MTLRILIINKYSVVARKGPRKFASLKYEDLEIDQEYFKHFDTSFAQNEIEYNEII